MTEINGLGWKEHEQRKFNNDSSIRVSGVTVPGFDLPSYDEIVLGYTGTLLTTVEYYKLSNLVATLTLSYTGTLLTGVVKS